MKEKEDLQDVNNIPHIDIMSESAKDARSKAKDELGEEFIITKVEPIFKLIKEKGKDEYRVSYTEREKIPYKHKVGAIIPIKKLPIAIEYEVEPLIEKRNNATKKECIEMGGKWDSNKKICRM